MQKQSQLFLHKPPLQWRWAWYLTTGPMHKELCSCFELDIFERVVHVRVGFFLMLEIKMNHAETLRDG